jgi:hypothetical protein
MLYRFTRSVREDKRYTQLKMDRSLWQYRIDSKTALEIRESAGARDTACCFDLRAAQAGNRH